MNKSSPLYIFDLDGVLIDNKKAISSAYLKAGALMPTTAWGLPWQEWTTEEIHDKKNLYYRNYLKEHGRILPLAFLAASVNSGILTMASLEAVNIAKEFLNIDIPVLGSSVTIEKKIEIINNLKKEWFIMYFDDNLSLAKLISDATGVSVVGVIDVK